ncbi:MAG: nucleotidyltransferase family protein [Fimbriimonadaceae bacterium]
MAAARLNTMNLTEQQLRRIAEICSANGVRSLALFGPRARGETRSESDLDLLVAFEPGRTPGFLGVARLADLLSLELGGVEVDLRTKRYLSRYFREEVVRSAEVIYSC